MGEVSLSIAPRRALERIAVDVIASFGTYFAYRIFLSLPAERIVRDAAFSSSTGGSGDASATAKNTCP